MTFCATKHQALTAVAGGSTVAGAGAVTVEGAPRLTAAASMFTVTGGTPERKTDRERAAYCQMFSKKKLR